MASSKPQKSTPWSVDEVQALLSLVGEDRIQREEIAQLLAAQGYNRTHQQCRDKMKKMKCDYRAIKDHNGRSGANRKTWRWYGEMDAIYGERPANKGRECGLDSATLMQMADDESLNDPPRSPSPIPEEPAAASTPGDCGPSTSSDTASGVQRVVTGKRKRLFQSETVAMMREIQDEDVVQQGLNRAVIRESQEYEATLRREENAETAAFNRSFLALMGQLVQAMSDRRN